MATLTHGVAINHEDDSMSNSTMIGSVIAYAGQSNPVSGDANNTWKSTKCGQSNAASEAVNPEVPLNILESSGWMLCDGRSLSVEANLELFSVIGYLYGQQQNGDEFFIPDYRGMFLRGVDAGSGMDPDAAERSSPTGDGSAEGIGSFQCDALETHVHTYTSVVLAAPAQSGNAAGQQSSDEQTSAPDSPAKISSETRPKNIAVNYIIKFR